MQVKVPRTELLIKLGDKTMPAYITEKRKNIVRQMKINEHWGYIEVEVARTPENKTWYPGCGQDIVWTTASFKSSHIIGLLKLPNPKVSVNYGEFS